MSLLHSQLIRGAMFPNLDFRVELGADLSASQHRVLLVDATMFGYAPSVILIPPLRVAGILQNAPGISDVAVIRLYGWSNVVYGDTVTAGDLLRPEESGTFDRLVPFVMGTDGHTHLGTSAETQKALVKVTSMITGAGVTGLVDVTNFVTSHKYLDDADNLTDLVGGYSVTELNTGGGWYVIASTTNLYLDRPHIFQIDPVDPTHVITPSQHQFMARNTSTGGPNAASYRFCMGQALLDGVADDVGLVLLRPQLF